MTQGVYKEIWEWIKLEEPEGCCQESKRGNTVWRTGAWMGKAGKLQIEVIAKADIDVDGLFHVEAE